MKRPGAFSAVVILLMMRAATAAIVDDPRVVPVNPAGAVAFNTVSWVPNQYSTTKSTDIWTIEPDGSSLNRFVGPGAQIPKFSPDGKWLYFESNAVGGLWSIYRSPVDGSLTDNLSPNGALGQESYGPTFAAHSSRMLYTSYTDGVAKLGSMDLDGSNARIVNPGLGYHYMGSLSPDGSEIVFSHTEDGYRLKRMDYDGTNVVSLVPNLPQSYIGQYTPDGQTIVFLNIDGDLYSVGRDGSNSHRLTTGNNYTTFYITSPTGDLPSNPDEQHGSTDWPRISPDGQQIAYISKGTGIPQLYLMNIDGSNQRQLTHLPSACGRVEWSPMGDELAFVSFDAAGRSQLFLIDVAGGTPKQLTEFTDRSVNFIAWSPAMRGDINGDGEVNLTDYGLLKSHWLESNVGDSAGDLNYDGMVDILDFAIFKRDYVTANGGGSSVALPHSVPEPSRLVLVLLAVAIFACLLYRRFVRGDRPAASTSPQHRHNAL